MTSMGAGRCSISPSSIEKKEDVKLLARRAALRAFFSGVPMNSSTRAIRFASSAAAMLVTMAASASDPAPQRFAGVDLSYVHEVEACGAKYRLGGQLRDQYEVVAD